MRRLARARRRPRPARPSPSLHLVSQMLGKLRVAPCAVGQSRLARHAPSARRRAGDRADRVGAARNFTLDARPRAATHRAAGQRRRAATLLPLRSAASPRFTASWSRCSTATACRRASTAAQRDRRRVAVRRRPRAARLRTRLGRAAARRARPDRAGVRAIPRRLRGKASPVHFFWGSFDLAVTRFSGRAAPPHPGGIPGLPDRITREAYSHEVSSAGFWPGGVVAAEPHFLQLRLSRAAGLPRRRSPARAASTRISANSSCPMPRSAPPPTPRRCSREFLERPTRSPPTSPTGTAPRSNASPSRHSKRAPAIAPQRPDCSNASA